MRRPFKYSTVLLALGSGLLAAAQQGPISDSTFRNDPHGAAVSAAPLWHFDEKTCMPADGTDGKGNPNKGNAPDNCNALKTNHNCTPQPKKNGKSTEATSFPTYYTVRHCDSDGTWRIVYDVYFTKDTGHRHDWEWAAVRFVRDPSGADAWVRDGIWMERDGKTPYVHWSDIESTYFNDGDISQDGQKGKDHAKLYFGKWHHPVFPNKYTTAFANTCPPTSNVDYRSDDYFYAAAKNLAPGTDIHPDWNYGSADSSPPSFGPGGKHDVCKLSA